MHVHIGLVPAITVYAMWLVIHTIVQIIAIQFHQTRFGQALAMIG